MKLSFLILTHNRPELFKRCIKSILQFNFNFDIEIFVNNDSNDICKIYDDNISIIYFNKVDSNLGNIYKFLFDQATGDYIYFLEDDDYLSKNFQKYFEPAFCEFGIYDLFYMNYKKVNNLKNFQKFEIEEKNIDFQLSQILFRRNILSQFPNELLNNEIDNDWRLFQILLNKTKSIYSNSHIMYIQTCDGNDNISFPLLNKDNRWSNQNL
jgi:glycosyltransferase involved in cell wall biosynthesis